MKNTEICADGFKVRYEAFINGCDSLEDIGLWDKENLGEMEAFYTNDLASIIIRLIATDGYIVQEEVDYFNKTFGFGYSLDKLVELYNDCKENIDEAFDENFENGITYMRKINGKLAEEYKELLYMVCDIIINSDGIVTAEEISEIEKLRDMCKSK